MGLPEAYEDENGFYADLEARVLAAVRDVADFHGHKVLARWIGKERPHVSKACSGSDRHRFTLQHLVRIIAHAPNDDLIQVLASIRQPPATPEEELAALKDAVSEFLGEEGRKGLLRKAERALVRNRVRRAK